MRRWRLVAGLSVLGLGLAVAGAEAGRTETARTSGQRSTGARQDITVPYLSNGKNAFGAASVAPKIYSSPTVDDPKQPQARPVYNLIFYGSKQGYGDKSNGAKPRTP